MRIAAKTNRTVTPEFGPPEPVYEGPPLDGFGDRIYLEDGTACFVWHDPSGNSPLPVLCTELVSLDAGDNVVHRVGAADDKSLQGIASRGSKGRGDPNLTVCPADGSTLGYYRSVE